MNFKQFLIQPKVVVPLDTDFYPIAVLNQGFHAALASQWI